MKLEMNIRSLRLIVIAFCLIRAAIAQQENKKQAPVDIPQDVHAVHARLFDSRGVEPVAQAVRDGEGGVTVGKGLIVIPLTGMPSITETIQRLTCRADAVAIVSVKDGESSLSSKQNWVFTDYLATVEEIAKDNANRPLRVGGDIVIARSGGKVEITPGKWVVVNESSMPPLLPGKRYVVFLRYISESREYQSTGSELSVVADHVQPIASDPFLDNISREYGPPGLVLAAKKATCPTESPR